MTDPETLIIWPEIDEIDYTEMGAQKQLKGLSHNGGPTSVLAVGFAEQFYGPKYRDRIIEDFGHIAAELDAFVAKWGNPGDQF